MAKSIRREFLQLANPYVILKFLIAGWFASEKLDGTRCLWDGGITRGMATKDVPWASLIDPKTGKPKAKIKPESTGLWSRYGNPIMAPDWFLNRLPCCPLDGELWAGRGNFQLCRSICAGDDPDPRFDQIKYAVYGSPGLPQLFASGEIKNSNMHVTIDCDSITRWLLSFQDRIPDMEFAYTRTGTFADELAYLALAIDCQNDSVFLHRQVRLSDDETQAREEMEAMLASILDKGGEGIMLHNPNASWTPKRHNDLLKYKPFIDDEATVVGFTAGKEGKTGQLLGHIGALIVEWNGVEFELGTGMTHAERRLTDVSHKWAAAHPGESLREHLSGNTQFRPGTTVTFKYRELTDDGIPKEARYWRVRDVE